MKKLVLATLIGSFALTACNKQEEAEPELQTVAEQAKQNAEEAEQGGVTVDNVFIRESHPGQRVSAAYITLHNHSAEDVEATAISSNVSDVTEFHTMAMDSGQMVMRKLDEVIIPANGSFVMKNGGNHIMFIDLPEPMKADTDVTINIELSNGETLEINGKAQPMEMNAESDDMGDMKDMDKDMAHEGHDHADQAEHEMKDEQADDAK